MNEEKILLNEIEILRVQLTELVNKKGYTHNDTVEISQQLDFLINRYNNMIHLEKDN